MLSNSVKSPVGVSSSKPLLFVGFSVPRKCTIVLNSWLDSESITTGSSVGSPLHPFLCFPSLYFISSSTPQLSMVVTTVIQNGERCLALALACRLWSGFQVIIFFN